MVIFISDLHLTDGTFDFGNMVHDTSAEAFKMFWDDILRIVEANASEGFNIKKIQVVLLGDILELRTTARWMNVKTRPWSEKPNQLSNDGVNILSEIIDNIIFKDTKNKILRERSYYLSTNFLDLIDKENGLYKLIKKRRVNVSFIYLPGNHDRLILDNNAAALRKLIEDKLGWDIVLGNPDLAYEPRFKDENLGIVANHGHKCDFMDFFKDYLQPVPGDLLPDILGRMMNQARNLKGVPPLVQKEIVKVILNIDLVRPSPSAFDWLLNKIRILESAKGNPQAAATIEGLYKVLLNTLKELLKDLEKILNFLYPYIQNRANKLSAVAVSAYFLKDLSVLPHIFWKKENALKDLLKKIAESIVERLEKSPDKLLETLEKLAKKINRILPDREKKKKSEEELKDPHGQEARKLLRDTGCCYVLFGHTHDYEIRPMDVGENAFYFNTGTWKKSVVKNYPAAEVTSFQKWARMTYVIFFDKGENKDHVFDLWHGNLQFEDDKAL